MPPVYRPTAADHPRGSALLFTLVVLTLLGLMGVSIMVNARTELSVSHNTYMGRDAFRKADSTARLALFLGRALLNASAGSPCDFLNNNTPLDGRPSFTVKVGSNVVCENGGGSTATDLTLENVGRPSELPTLKDMTDRYLQATGSADAVGSAFTTKPNLTILYDGQVVGTAALSIYYSDMSFSGASGGGGGSLDDGNRYGGQGENSVRVYLVVSADGRLPRAPGADEGNYYSGNVAAPHSIITAVFREIIVN